MHGTYQLTETHDGVRFYAHGSDLDALIASFPALSFVDPNPRTVREKWTIAGLSASVSLLLLTIGSASEMERQHVPSTPALEPAKPAAPAAPIQPAVALETAQTTPAPADAAPQVEPRSQPAPTAPLVEVAPDTLAANPAPSENAEFEVLLAQAAPTVSEAEALGAPPQAGSPNQGGITHLTARVNGAVAGELEFSDAGQTISVNLGSVLALLADRFPPEEYARLASSPAAGSFVRIDTLAEAGLGISYDPVYDEILLETSAPAAGIAADQSQVPSAYS